MYILLRWSQIHPSVSAIDQVRRTYIHECEWFSISKDHFISKIQMYILDENSILSTFDGFLFLNLNARHVADVLPELAEMFVSG